MIAVGDGLLCPAEPGETKDLTHERRCREHDKQAQSQMPLSEQQEVSLLGIAAIFAGSTVFACLHYIYGKIRGTLKPGGTVAMAPYVFIATVIYLVFFWGAFDFLGM